MSHTPSRRTVLRGLTAGGLTATGAAVMGFAPATRSWATTPSAAGPGALVGTPPLDGSLTTDESSLAAASDDFGHIVHRRPAAVLRPGSVGDVVAMVRFCRAHRLPVAPRGQGHATNGQAQVAGGLVIETAPLAGIGPVGPDSTTVTVGAGVRWSEVAKATIPHGLTPPVFTDYLELSVGGTLSVGGLGGQTHRHGAQVVLDRLAPAVAALKEAGLWSYAHPWLNLLLPGRSAAALASRMLEALTPADLGGPGLVLVYPLLRDRLTTPLLRTPDDPVPYLFALLRASPPEDTATVDRLLTANRSAYELTTAAGGTRYPVGSIPVSRADWRAHFGRSGDGWSGRSTRTTHKQSWSRARASSEPTRSDAYGRGRVRPVCLSRLEKMPHNA